MCSYFHAEQTRHAAALMTDCSLSSWFPVDRKVCCCHNPDGTSPASRPATVVLLATQTDECCSWRSTVREAAGHSPVDVGPHRHVAVCLSGRSWMAAPMSSTVSERKLTNVQPDGAEKNDGVGVLSVNARTSVTFARRDDGETPRH